MSATAAFGLAVVALGSAPSPAVASDGDSGPAFVGSVGAGRALVRIDAASATVTRNADGSFTLTLPAGSKGQFFGERLDVTGKKRLRVGNVSAKQLMKKWNAFRYTSAGVNATIAWESKTPATLEGAMVRLFKPSVTSGAVKFRFTTTRSVPATLHDVTVNLQRAPGRSARTTYTVQNTVTLSGNMKFFAGFYDGGKVDTHLMNGSSYCWSYAFGAEGSEAIPSMSCAGIPQWGGTVTWKAQSSPWGSTGVYLYTNLQPSGQAAFIYNQEILTIDVW
jgi:hypothetical protein